jgi:uncharacterized ion transporter superfamily protein YfcC
MNLILGMDLGVFLAWIGTLLVTVLCIIYGIYYQFVKKNPEETEEVSSKDESRKKEEDQ